jgi:hypothetical protein
VNPAREKVEREGLCRVCGLGGPERLDAAHTWNRSEGGPGFDDPDAVVPLCSSIKGAGPRACHDLYDAHQLDLLPHLTTPEQVALVRYAGSIERARDRAMGRARLNGQRHGDAHRATELEPDKWGPF